jgi:hypothetical protein
MRLDEITTSYYNSIVFNDDEFDVQLNEIDDLCSEIDEMHKDTIDTIDTKREFVAITSNKSSENHTDSIIFYTMFKATVIIVICRAMIIMNSYII